MKKIVISQNQYVQAKLAVTSNEHNNRYDDLDTKRLHWWFSKKD